MKYNWIDAKEYSLNCFLFFDRWILRYIFKEQDWYDGDYKTDMAKALCNYPYVYDYCLKKVPECKRFLSSLRDMHNVSWTNTDIRNAETRILQALETFVVYAYPEVMEKVNYIRNWDEKYLFELAEFTGKIVLDVGAGTGRLAFAAAKKALRVYASEPCDCLREYMKDKIKKHNINNVKILDGEVLSLPYEDNTFDIVMSGHVIGDFYEEEIAEITRITKNGGWLVICNGDDEFQRSAPDEQLTSRGFEWLVHTSIENGIIYNYRKQVIK